MNTQTEVTARPEGQRVDVVAYNVMLRGMKVGVVSFHDGGAGAGWRHIPLTTTIQPSRKLWPTPQAATKGRVHKDATLEAVS